MFLIEVGWITLAVWRRWGFVAKPAILTTIVHSGLLLTMVLWTAHFVRSVLPPTLLTSPNARRIFAVAIMAWLVPILIIAIGYNRRARQYSAR